VPFTPSLSASVLHGWILAAAGGTALGTGRSRSGASPEAAPAPRWLVGLGVLALVVASADLALYLDHFLRQAPLSAALPAGQKPTAALVLAFVWLAVERATGAAAVEARRERRARSRAGRTVLYAASRRSAHESNRLQVRRHEPR
jgi:hypothetical protein